MMARGYSYDLGDGISDLGRSGRQALLGLAKWREESDQGKRDAEYLDWLTGQVGQVAPPADIPVPPPSMRPGEAPVQGPQLPQGMAEPDPSVAPTPGGLPGGAPYSNNSLENGPEGLAQAQKGVAKDLFSSPEQTMNLLIEAKRRRVSPNMGSLLEFITNLHKERAQAADTDKKEKAKADLTMKREAARAASQDVRTRVMERIADARNRTARDVAGIHAGASRYATDHRSLKPGEQDFHALSVDDLHALKDSLSNDESELSQPDRSLYDAYDPLSISQFREDYKSYDDTRNEIRKTIRKLDAEISLRERAQGGGQGAQPPAPKPSSANVPGGRVADTATLVKYVQAAGGDKAKARELLTRDGWAIPQ